VKLLIDTHALLWFMADSPNLTKKAREAIETLENERFVSMASAWEMALKVSRKKLTLPFSFEQFFPEGLEARGFQGLHIQFRHVAEVLKMPFHHNDPFDRIMIAQAKVEQLTIVTGDALFAAYGVPTIW
jgi:PIN domain nuclease of toxin-antitoxin system